MVGYDEKILREGYSHLVDPEVEWQDAAVDCVGECFIGGTMGGFPYHLVKGLRQNLKIGTALRLACHKAPHVGSAVLGIFVAAEAGQLMDWSIRGKVDFYNLFFASALGGAALRAKHGIISASRSALCIGTLLTLGFAWTEQSIKMRDHEAYLANTNRQHCNRQQESQRISRPQ